MTISDSDVLDQVEAHLRQPNQAWLLGAGISKDAGLPLMNPLTARVRTMAAGKNHAELLQALSKEMDNSANIEHILSQLGDYTAIAGRAEHTNVIIDGKVYTHTDLENAHAAITADIAETIRWGYVEPQPANGDQLATPEQIGSTDHRLATVDLHKNFVCTLFDKLQAGLHERRRPVHFFTTNYDTLLEDALALARYRYWDGFSGGAIAFLEHRFGVPTPSDGYRAKVIKLHGSIDWAAGERGEVFRVRETDSYPPRTGRVLIYPQSTKYAATQKDPFAAQFSEFRRTLTGDSELVLAVCGYSFGDEHINEELELALSTPNNKTTILVFCREGNSLPSELQKWRVAPWGKRIYILTQHGVYCGAEGPLCKRQDDEHDWWSFKGLIRFLGDGGPGEP